MLTWREEGERSVAYIGEARCGSVGKRHWSGIGLTGAPIPDSDAFDWCAIDGSVRAAPTLSAAKAALAEAVGEWVKRAGLVHLPAGHVVVPREPTKAMVVASFCALRNHINSLPESDKLKYNGRKGGKRVDEYLKVTLRYTAMLSAHPSREELT